MDNADQQIKNLRLRLSKLIEDRRSAGATVAQEATEPIPHNVQIEAAEVLSRDEPQVVTSADSDSNRDVVASAELVKSSQGFGEDISVDEYMEQLLARMQTEDDVAPREHVESVPVRPAPSPSAEIDTTPEKNIPKPEPEQAQVVQPSKPTRDRQQEDVDKMRAKLDSFREVANETARRAVAKSVSEQGRQRIRQKMIAMAITWVFTAILFLTGLILSAQIPNLALLGLGVSLTTTIVWYLEFRSHQNFVKTECKSAQEPTVPEDESERQ